jgi:hypothetical protein
MDELHQSNHIPFGQPPQLAFADHVHHFVALNRPPGSVEGPKPLAGVNPPFERPVVLFQDVVQVRTGATATSPAQFSFCLQFRDQLGVGGVAVHIDHPGARVARSTPGFLEEALAGSRVTLGAEQKIKPSPDFSPKMKKGGSSAL